MPTIMPVPATRPEAMTIAPVATALLNDPDAWAATGEAVTLDGSSRELTSSRTP